VRSGVRVRDRLFPWRARHSTRPAPATEADGWEAWWRAHGDRELRCILMTAWDPLGVADAPEAWDEYDAHLGRVADMLRSIADRDAAEEAIAAYLRDVERDRQGMAGTPQADARIAALAGALIAWHEWSCRHGGRPPREWRG